MRISGVLPIKNGQPWISTNLPGILSTLSDMDELIILNNGSSDRSEIELSRLAKTDDRIMIVNCGDIGLVKALNLGISEARNEWIARFDIDDKYSSGRLKVQRELIDTDVVAIFSDYKFIGERNQNLGDILSPVLNVAVKASLINSERTAHPSALFNKTAFESVGGYIEKEFPAEDLGLWARLATVGEMLSADSIELFYSLRKGSISFSRRSDIERMTQSLIKQYNLSKWSRAALKDLDETLVRYSSFNKKSTRKLLHLRDLRSKDAIHSFSRSEIRRIDSQIMKHLFTPSGLVSSIKLLSGKIKRDNYRLR